MATTVFFPGSPTEPEFVGVLAAVPAPAEPAVDFGDSDSFTEFLPEVGVVAGVWATEFFRLAAFFERDEVPGVGMALPLPRFRFLMTSVFKLSGLTTPWSFRKRPHALHRG